jgi:hypothetical protein
MRQLKKIRMTVVMTGVCVIVKYLNALVECVDGKYYQNFLPLNGCELKAKEWHKVPKYCANG